MKDPKYKHFFKIRSGKFIWEDEGMFKYKKSLLEGKRGYAIIEEVEEVTTPNQYAYYFGGIIRKECMNSDIFHGLSDKQIHSALLYEVRGSVMGIKMPDGTTRTITVSEDFNGLGKKKMAQYINDVIIHLNNEYNIWPKPADHYKENQFYINPKHFR